MFHCNSIERHLDMDRCRKYFDCGHGDGGQQRPGYILLERGDAEVGAKPNLVVKPLTAGEGLFPTSPHFFKKEKAMPELDVKATHKDFVTPFDAHEQVTRGPHTFSKDEGYKANPDFEASEFPKAVDHVEGNEGQLEPVIARDEDHESELREGAK